MTIYRLHSGTDGQSHIEEINLITHPELAGHYMTKKKAEGFFFHEWRPGHSAGFHTAPQRLMAITLSGNVEIGLGDGSFHLFRPGDVRLVEETGGQGHTIKVVGDKPVVTAVILLPPKPSNTSSKVAKRPIKATAASKAGGKSRRVRRDNRRALARNNPSSIKGSSKRGS